MGAWPGCANDACAAFVLTGVFGLSMRDMPGNSSAPCADTRIDRSVASLPLLGAPASLAFGYVLSALARKEQSAELTAAASAPCT